MGSQLKVLFVDQITPTSIVPLLLRRPLDGEIWYFDAISPLSRRLLGVFSWLGLVRAELRHIEYHIGQVRNDDGESQYVKFLGDARAICSRIKRDHLVSNTLIKAMGSLWATRKILLYFEKAAEEEVRVECLRIGLVAWMLRTQLHLAPKNCAVLIEHKHWFPYLESYAALHSIRLIGYRSSKFRMIAAVVSRMLPVFRRTLLSLGSAILSGLVHPITKARPQPSTENSIAVSQPSTATIAIRYNHRKLSFDPFERSEFFFLNGSGIPYSEVLLYDHIADSALDVKTLEELEARGIRLLNRGPGIPVWPPTPRFFNVLLRTLLKVTLGVLTCLARRQWVSIYYVGKFLVLAMGYAYWLDFYSANRVRAHVGTNNTSIDQVLALDALGGVSFGYQYSASCLLSPTALLGAGENVQFVFSPMFKELFGGNQATVDVYVPTGFIYDGGIEAVRHLDRVVETRKQLQDNGARFILCFFDENSLNRWDIYASNEDAASDYEFLLRWLLADPTLGIVFKPKKYKTLFQRITNVSDLIEQARQSGRCRFLASDTLVGSIFPAEAALMADVCIGKLLGSTAALEARLAGVPTILVDNEGFRNHPFHAWRSGQVVFNDWESLRTAVENYRSAPDKNPDFGDWSFGLNDLDPFRDGHAGLHMGLYIHWVYEALKQGASKQDSLAIATEKFSQRWGSEHVTFNKVV